MQKRNYQKELENVIESGFENKVPRLLLHVCCAPCSSSVLEYLSKYFEITVFYYNPNIEPQSEFDFRLAEERRFVSEITPEHPVTVIAGEYENSAYHDAVKGLENEPEGGKRCEKCFYMRLKKTALLCKKENFDYFTTTLTVSPLKNADMLNAIGERAASETGARWLPCDFKKKNGYLRTIELSKKHNLYRQNYCGCVYSRANKSFD